MARKSSRKAGARTSTRRLGAVPKPVRERAAVRAAAARDDDADHDAPARSNPLGLEIDEEVLEFIAALEQFKKQHGRPFPSWSEVLHVLRSLGYRRPGRD